MLRCSKFLMLVLLLSPASGVARDCRTGLADFHRRDGAYRWIGGGASTDSPSERRSTVSDTSKH
jgi:hypothetical protein